MAGVVGDLKGGEVGQTVRNVEKSTGVLAVIMNVLWILVFGVQICGAHLFFALIFAITIVGLPFARQHIKLCAVALSPFGKEIIEA